jgi:GT2 family glycosyltransferase
MKEKHSISVVIPMFNSEGFIKRSIGSVMQQSVSADEVIVIDDGSTDGGAEIVRQTFPQVRVITIENSGEGYARNAGIEAAGSEWIAFLDADDFWLPNHLESAMSVISLINNAFIVATGIQKWVPTKPLVVRQPRIERGSVDYFAHQVNRWNVITSSSALVKKEAFNSVGGFKSLKMGADIDMWERLALQYNFARTTEVSAIYVKNVNGASAQFGQSLAAYSETSDLKPKFYRSENLGALSLGSGKKIFSRYQNQIRYATVTALLFHNQIELAKKEAKEFKGSAKLNVKVVLFFAKHLPGPILKTTVEFTKFFRRMAST